MLFGEHKAFWTFDYFIHFRLMLNKLKLPGVVFFSPKSGVFMPTDVEATTVVGRGIRLKGVNEKPTQEQIDQVHDLYMK